MRYTTVNHKNRIKETIEATVAGLQKSKYAKQLINRAERNMCTSPKRNYVQLHHKLCIRTSINVDTQTCM